MKSHILASTVLAGAVAAFSFAAILPSSNAQPVVAQHKVDDFRLIDATGRAHELYYEKDAPAVVLMMHAVGSHAVSKVAPELAKIQADYGAKGVKFFLVDSNPKDTREAMLADAAKNGITAPILEDENQLVGEQLGAKNVGEIFVIDPKTWKIAYRGPLSTAPLDALLAGTAPAETSVAMKGEEINFLARSPASRAAFAKVSYTNTIAPVLEAKCVACHQQGGIGPFAMDSYESVKKFAPMIRETIRTKRMPPWGADPHIGKFSNDKSLSSDQIKTLVHWIEAGAPRGDGPDSLAAAKHVAPEWPLGKPDLIVTIPRFTIPASGVVDYQFPSVPNPLTEGKWVKASTAVIDDRRGVHHVLSAIIPEGGIASGITEYGSGIGGYVPGSPTTINPPGIATYLPVGGKFGFQMHYTTFGKQADAQQKIGLYFYKDNEKPTFVMREKPIVNQFIDIPPNDDNHVETAYFDFPKEAYVYSAVVHSHLRGAYSKLELMYPNGKRETILNVPYYNFNWQWTYEFAKPVKIPAGSKLIATYAYDNSKKNFSNPNPNVEVKWGPQTFEEMLFTEVRYRWADETVADQKENDKLIDRTRILGMLDTDFDGKIEFSELRGQFKAMVPTRAAFDVIDKDHDGSLDQQEIDGAMGAARRFRGGPAPRAQAKPPAAQAGELASLSR